MSSIEQNEQLIAEIEKEDTTPIPRIPVIEGEYINITGKQAPLVNRVLDENISIQNGKICIKFTEPVWVYDLTLWLAEEDQSKSDKLQRHTAATITYARGGQREIAMAAFAKHVDCYPKDFLTEIEIKFSGINKIAIFTPPACQRISITGFNSEDFVDFCHKAGGYIGASKKLNDGKETLVAELRETNTRIEAAKESLSAIQSETENAKEEQQTAEEKLNKTQLQVSQAEAKVSILNSQSADLEQRINENNRNIQNLSESIQDNRQELERLLADKNVFMEELSSYVEQGEKNIKTYLAIGTCLFLILAACLWRLIESALKLSADPQLLATISAFDLFLSRLPLAFVLGGIIVLCIRLISNLLNKTFEIHQERLLLSKLSILAKDNSFSSAEGLEIEHGLVYDKRTSLKMELLKEFLSGNYKGAAEKEKNLRNSFEDFKENLKKESSKKRQQTEDNDEIEPDATPD